MHEAFLIQAVLEQAECLARVYNRQVVEKLCLRVGVLSGIVPEALTFAFEALKGGTLATTAQMEIELVPARARCLGCGHTFALEELGLPCPLCCTMKYELLEGKELELARIVLA